MPEKNATNSGMLSLLPPDEVQALFGDPPLLKGEDVSLYNNPSVPTRGRSYY